MTGDYNALLRGVLIDPADDFPRLILADWLDDNGDPDRANFVRQLIEPDEGDFGDLQSVLERHWKSWIPECGNGRIGFEVRRGFVYEVELPLADFLSRAKELFESHPIERVVLTDRKPIQVRDGVRTFSEWRWFRHSENASAVPSEEVPSVLFDRLEGCHTQTNGADWVRWYDTQESARNALSAAAVAYGRELAGLPELVRTEGATK